MNPMQWSTPQWVGFISASLGLIGAGAWWQDIVSAHHVASVQSGVLTLSGIVHLMLGKTDT